MPKISVIEELSTGTHGDMIGTASSPGLVPVKWNGYLTFRILVLEDGSTYLKFWKGHADPLDELTIRTGEWPVYPLLGIEDFYVTWDSGTSKYDYIVKGTTDKVVNFGKRGQMTLSGGTYTYKGSAWWDYNQSDQYSDNLQEDQEVSLSTLSSLGYIKILSLSNWPINNQRITLYALGMVLSNMPTTVNEINTLNAYPLTIDVPAKLLKYYPWERRINNIWYSLNRNGYDSTESGLFRRENGKWAPVLNSGIASEEQNGFRYKNGWVKSPKSGTGA